MGNHYYEVIIQGNVYDARTGEWGDHEPIGEEFFDSLYDAAVFCSTFNAESAVMYETESGCNGLDIIILERNEEGGVDVGEFALVGEYEWVEDRCVKADPLVTSITEGRIIDPTMRAGTSCPSMGVQ